MTAKERLTQQQHEDNNAWRHGDMAYDNIHRTTRHACKPRTCTRAMGAILHGASCIRLPSPPLTSPLLRLRLCLPCCVVCRCLLFLALLLLAVVLLLVVVVPCLCCPYLPQIGDRCLYDCHNLPIQRYDEQDAEGALHGHKTRQDKTRQDKTRQDKTSTQYTTDDNSADTYDTGIGTYDMHPR